MDNPAVLNQPVINQAGTDQQTIKSERELLIEQHMAHPVHKYLYHPNPVTCMRRILLYVIRGWESEDQQIHMTNQIIWQMNLTLLFPGVKLSPDAVESEHAKLLKQHTKGKKNGKQQPAYLLGFVIDKVVSDTIPAEDLVIPSKKQKLLAKEVSYILKTILEKFNQDLYERSRWGLSNKDYRKHISNRYFLGDYKGERLPRAPKLKEGVTTGEAYHMGYHEGYKAALAACQTKKPNSYPEQYEKATGRKLNADKFAAITKLLEKHGLIRRHEVPSTKNPKCTAILYKVMSKAVVKFTQGGAR